MYFSVSYMFSSGLFTGALVSTPRSAFLQVEEKKPDARVGASVRLRMQKEPTPEPTWSYKEDLMASRGALERAINIIDEESHAPVRRSLDPWRSPRSAPPRPYTDRLPASRLKETRV